MRGKLFISLLEMRHKVSGLTGGPDGPSNLAGGHRQSVDQDAGAVADVLMFASLALAWLGRFSGRFALKHLHAGFFIAADHQTALLVGLERLGVQLADSVGFGIKLFIMAIQPVCTLVGLEINVLQDTPDT